MTRRRKCRSSAGRFACRSIQCQAWAISRFARTRKGICLRCGNPIRTQNRIELEARRMSEGDIKTETAPESDVSRLADHLFREESGKLVSVLTGISASSDCNLLKMSFKKRSCARCKPGPIT